MPQLNNQVTIFTDGSCHTQKKLGGWAAILFIGGKKMILSGWVLDTTHNRMELTAVIEAIKYTRNEYPGTTSVKIITDSQYLVGLPGREQKLAARNFTTNKGVEIRNADLVKELLEISNDMNLEFIKIKAHQKQTDTLNYNIEADKLSRKIVRDGVDS